MSNSLFEHDFQKDLKPNQNTYCTQDIQWKYINDNNQGNYSNGYIKKSVMIRLRLHPWLTAFARSFSVYGTI